MQITVFYIGDNKEHGSGAEKRWQTRAQTYVKLDKECKMARYPRLLCPRTPLVENKKDTSKVYTVKKLFTTKKMILTLNGEETI